MFTALIAEDSKPILRNIKSLLESSGLPVQIVSTASNGEEALDLIRQQPVDILITDIRMPKLDGLALIEQAKELCPQLKVVLISSYSDFEYTRKALNLQVFDYLLKPVERQGLIDVMSRLVEQLREMLTERLEGFRGIVAPEYLSRMLPGDEFYEQSAKLALLLRRHPFTASGGTHWKPACMVETLLPVCFPHVCRILPLEGTDMLVMLAQPSLSERYGSADDWMNAVAGALREQSMVVSMAGSLQPFDLSNLHLQYDKLKHGMSIEMRLQTPLRLDVQYRFPQPPVEDRTARAFAEMIGQRQKGQFQLKLPELLKRWHEDNVPFARLETLLYNITEAFASADGEPGDPDERLLLDQQTRELLRSDNYDSFCASFAEWTDDQFDLLLSRSRKSAEELFKALESHMRLHLYSQLSISDAALKFHVSPSYISRIIKRYTNDTFVHHYMSMKIEEACRLMESKPEMKIREISDALAFGDQHYFSRVFKEYTACSPSEYKERLKRGDY